jgi:hypothetical protein
MSEIDMMRSKEIKRKRLLYAIPGFALGIGLIALITLVFDEGKFGVTKLIMGGLLGSGCALRIGEKFRGLPSGEGLEIIRIREEMAPSDLKPEHAIPKALKTETEKSLQL